MAVNNCPACGAQLNDGALFCTHCGSKAIDGMGLEMGGDYNNYDANDGAHKAPRFETSEAYAAEQNKNRYGGPRREPVGNEDRGAYEPISTWGYVGILLLLLIPLVNIVLLIVWACGGCRKINLRNFARAQLLVGAIAYVLIIILCIAAAMSFSSIDIMELQELSGIIEQM